MQPTAHLLGFAGEALAAVQTRCRRLLAASVAILLGTPASGIAQPVVVPSGLCSGDEYRLAFVTSTSRDADSCDIAEYNDFVTKAAKSVPSLDELPATWRALGTTKATEACNRSVNARDNTDTNPANWRGVPIYLLDGRLLARDNQDLWDGDLAAPIDVTEEGSVASPTLVWTGTDADGAGLAGGELGRQSVAAGSTQSAGSDWVHSLEADRSAKRPLYAISSVLSDFPNGVAAGDVDQDSVVLWARAVAPGLVEFQIGLGDFSTIVATEATTVVDVNEPAKVTVNGLQPGTQYVYRACLGGCPARFCASVSNSTATGRFRTPYEDEDGEKGLRFGTTSCLDDGLRPFASLQNVPEQDLDFFVFLGDNIYGTDPNDGKPGTSALKDWRIHYKRTNSPLGNERNPLAELRASTAIYATIDDHDVRDNFSGGAEPYREFCQDEETFLERQECRNSDFINGTRLYNRAMRAFHEYHPIAEEKYGNTGGARTEHRPKLYRYRTFGTDAAIMLLDARSFRREPGLLPSYNDDGKMLGDLQRHELQRNLKDARDRGITWKFVLVSVPIFEIGLADYEKFASYAQERTALLQFIEEEGIDNVVFVSGDIHGQIVNNLVYQFTRSGNPRGSRAWDISTGPAAHSPTLANFLSRLLVGNAKDGYENGDRAEKDRILERALNELVLDNDDPPVGLCGPDVPATLLKGSYMNVHTNGWTEFDVDAATQTLTVTNYGIDTYDSKDIREPRRFRDENPPKIVSRFEVAPKFSGNVGPVRPNLEVCDEGPVGNRPPFADAGVDQTLECTSPDGAPVTLDGTGSFDPDGDPIEYVWTNSFGTATGPTPTLPFPLGTETVSLVVYDDAGAASAPDAMQVTVQDTVGPKMAVSAQPAVLWPPNGKMVPVRIEADARDACDAAPVCSIANISSSEGGDWKIKNGLSLELRAKRQGKGSGQTYTIGVRCVDSSGNRSMATTQVLVPHDRSNKPKKK